MRNMKFFLFATVALAVAGSASASQIVYRPVNPSLGGDSLNGSWLLSQASAQDKGAAQSPGFSIDFPDFGGVTQPNPNPSTLPNTNGNNN